MASSFFFIFAIIFLLINMILIYKVPHKISCVKSFIICFVTELCFCALIGQLYSIFNILININTMGIAFLVIGGIILFYNIKRGRKQELSITKIELISILAICIWFGIIFIKVFTLDINMSYVNVDPANHFSYAMRVAETGKLSSMFFAELYNGLFLQIFQPVLNELTYYKAFILAESVANLLNVFLFYCIGDCFAKTRFTQNIMSLICFLYFMGWPFYSYVIGGFVHFGWGVTLIAYIVFLVMLLNNTDNNTYKIVLGILCVIACYCVLVCYMYFVPVVGMFIVYSLVKILKKGQVQISKKQKILMGIILICMAIGAVLIGFLGFFRGSIESFTNLLGMEGGIHRELYKDFLFLLPPAVYMFIQRKKEKKLNEIYEITGIILLYIGITFVFCYMRILSPYYYYKSYYMLWFFIWIICVDAIDFFIQKDRLLIYSYGGVVCLIIFTSLLGIENSQLLRDRNIVPNELVGHENHASVPVYGQSDIYMSRDANIEDWKAFVDICNKVNGEYPDANEKIRFISESYYMGAWFANFTGGSWGRVESRENISDVIYNLEALEENYIIMEQDTVLFRENKELFEHLEKIYDNGYYGLYQ